MFFLNIFLVCGWNINDTLFFSEKKDENKRKQEKYGRHCPSHQSIIILRVCDFNIDSRYETNK